MPRTYTLAQANALLGELTEEVLRLRVARATLLDRELLVRLAERVAGNGGGADASQHAAASVEMAQGLRRIEEWGVVLRDIEQGLCDFPGLRDGREVYLCWIVGEDHVEFWHELEAGFRGRAPIDDLVA